MRWRSRSTSARLNVQSKGQSKGLSGLVETSLESGEPLGEGRPD